jgi:uncharacterized membrane protein YfcA
MDILSTLLLGALVSGATQCMKKLLPEVNPLLWVAFLAVIGGFLCGIVVPLFPQEVIEKVVYSFTVAIGLYETLKTFIK